MEGEREGRIVRWRKRQEIRKVREKKTFRKERRILDIQHAHLLLCKE